MGIFHFQNITTRVSFFSSVNILVVTRRIRWGHNRLSLLPTAVWREAARSPKETQLLMYNSTVFQRGAILLYSLHSRRPFL